MRGYPDITIENNEESLASKTKMDSSMTIYSEFQKPGFEEQESEFCKKFMNLNSLVFDENQEVSEFLTRSQLPGSSSKSKFSNKKNKSQFLSKHTKNFDEESPSSSANVSQLEFKSQPKMPELKTILMIEEEDKLHLNYKSM